MAPAERIASLLPSCTEIACALGLRERLVGRSHECDVPPGVEALPALTEPKLDASAPAAEIDASVRRLVRDGLSVYRVDEERLRALRPDVILTQEQCEVCAASPRDLEAALLGWPSRPRVLSLDPATLGDVWGDLVAVAEACGVPERGPALAEELAGRVTEVAERTQRRRPHPSVVCLEWTDPLMGAGHWIPELVTLAGGRALLAESGGRSQRIALEDVARADPDAIVVAPCGFDLARSAVEAKSLAGQPGWAALRAVREGRVFLADGHHYFNRPGPRLVETLEILAEILHPDEFAPRHRGDAWRPA